MIECRPRPETRLDYKNRLQTQNGKLIDTSSDISSGPSEKYWEVLAERRRVALEETLKENQKLHDTIALLKEECSEYKQLLKDSEDLVETLKLVSFCKRWLTCCIGIQVAVEG
uniref:Geminin n=1 Tax=Timema monikensis TaxID=170555 RepID=A0A7R9E847_9NEOP|nr:unnamed protein product [Timema monikensis]